MFSILIRSHLSPFPLLGEDMKPRVHQHLLDSPCVLSALHIVKSDDPADTGRAEEQASPPAQSPESSRFLSSRTVTMATAFSIQAECLKINHALLPVDILLRGEGGGQQKVEKFFHWVLPHLLDLLWAQRAKYTTGKPVRISGFASAHPEITNTPGLNLTRTFMPTWLQLQSRYTACLYAGEAPEKWLPCRTHVC